MPAAVHLSTLPALLPALWCGLAYRRRARTLASEGRGVARWRQWCFFGGLAVELVAVVSPLGELSDRLLSAHMVEHLLIGDIGALALVLGLSGPLLMPLLRRRALGRLRAFAHPLLAAPAWGIDFYIWHLPALYQAALRHEAIHVAQHGCFLFFGMAMWMALIGPLPKPAWFGNFARLLYVIAVRLSGAVLGNVLIWSHTVFYPYYDGRTGDYGLSVLSDQGLAGAIMMIEGSLLSFSLFAWLFWRGAAESDERQALLDYAREHSIVLEDARAARAVAAGQGAQLRRRLEEAAGGGRRHFATMSLDADDR